MISPVSATEQCDFHFDFFSVYLNIRSYVILMSTQFFIAMVTEIILGLSNNCCCLAN